MALFIDQMDEEERRRRELEEGGQPSGPGGIITGAGTDPVAGRQPGASGRFVNLKAYLDANAGNSAAGKIVEGVRGQAETAKSTLSGARSEFDEAIQKGGLSQDTALVDRVTSNPLGLADEDKQKFIQQRTASYTGPTSLLENEKGQEASRQVGRVNESLASTKSEPGRFALLEQMLGRPSYTQGQKALDQLLIQNDPSARTQFDQLNTDYSTFNNDYETAKKGASDAATARRAETETARTYATTKGQEAVGGLRDTVQNRVKDFMNQRQSGLEEFRAAVAARDVTPVQEKRFGLKEDTILYGLNPEEYLNVAGDPSIDEVATSDEASRAAALAELMGESSFLGDPSSVGTYDPANAVRFNDESFSNAAKARQDAYQQEILNTHVGVADEGLETDNVQMTIPQAILALTPYMNNEAAYLQETGQDPTTGPMYQKIQKLKAQMEAIRQRYGYNDRVR